MFIIVLILTLLVLLALAAPRFGADSRSGPEWSVGALLQPAPDGQASTGRPPRA